MKPFLDSFSHLSAVATPDSPREAAGLPPTFAPSGVAAPPGVNTSTRDGFVFISDPKGDAANRYRRIAATMLAGSWSHKRILITSPRAGEGKTLTAVNLALAIAEQGHSVFFAELNLMRPRCRYVFGSPDGRGVESVLKGEATPEEVTFQLGDTRIAIASVAMPMPDSLLVRPGPNLDKLLAYGESGFQWSILDVPPIQECPAIREIASQAGPVVMVARSRRTKLNVFRRAAAALGSDLDYVLLNDAA